jgi:molybdate transport system permease protein
MNQKGTGTFRILSSACLIFLALFLLTVIFSAFTFMNPIALSSALLCKEIHFAVALTLVTASIATILSLLVSLPAAYFLSRAEFFG